MTFGRRAAECANPCKACAVRSLCNTEARPMAAMDALCEGLGGLLHDRGSRLPIKALGVVLEDGADQILLVIANVLGVAAYRGDRGVFPAVVIPDAVPAGAPVALDLESHPDGFLEKRLLLTGYADEVRKPFGVRRVRALVLSRPGPRAAILLGTGEREASDAGLDAELELLARQI